MTHVSAVMIVKNEAHCVTRALDSVRAGVDDWVVMDTGSTDGTVELLESYRSQFPGHVFSGPFEDFSQAKNRVLHEGEKRADWCVILDADMEWRDISQLRAEIEQTPDEVDGLATEILDVQTEGDKTYWQVRAFRSGRGWRYRYRTHEIPWCPTLRVEESSTAVLHHANGGSREGRLERDLRLLGLDLADNPHDPVTHYYLGGTYLNLERPREAISAYRKSLRYATSPDNEHCYMTRMQLAKALSLGGFPDAEVDRMLLESVETRPWRREALHRLLTRLVERRQLQAAAALGERFLPVTPPSERHEYTFFDPTAEPLCYFELARAYAGLGNSEGYRTARERTLSDPHAPDAARRVIASWPAKI